MRNTRGIFLSAIGAALAVAAMAVSASSAQAQTDKTFVMKLGVATINDTQHEWLRRFVAAVEKDSNGRIKGEIYPASQLGPIPRMIEGVQFGSIQGWIGPPEFLVGVDIRYEALSAPGLMNNFDQTVKVLFDPAVQKMMFELGENKGLEGIGFAPIGPSVDHHQEGGQASRRPQGPEAPRARLAVPARADPADGCQSRWR